nr:hypothetical protein [uncultured Holophaga sp.]
MTRDCWIRIFTRHLEPGAELSWEDLLVGYDFSLVSPLTLLAWAAEQAGKGPALQTFQAMRPDDPGFEAALWEACMETSGTLPRPGHLRWERAQDRWRLALLREVLDAPLEPRALGAAVEAIYERVGCPEDMLGLWNAREGEAERPGILRFVARLDEGLRKNSAGHRLGTCYTSISAGV